MVMANIDNDLVQASVLLCKKLDGADRTEFIEDAYIDYKWCAHIETPREVQRHLRNVFTKLVKNFGH